jgi:hypothetical protein
VLPLPEAEFRSAADWAIAYTASFLTDTACIPLPLARYRIHSANLSGTTRTVARLDARFVEQTLVRMEKVLDFANRVARGTGPDVIDPRRVRNVVEHRLMLAILDGEGSAASRAGQDLRDAYRAVPGDYPRWRYALWLGLVGLPPRLSRGLLATGFRAARARAWLRGRR